MTTNPNNENQLGLLNLVVFVLSIYVLLAILVDTVLVLPKETSILLTYIDNAICFFFFAEFCVRLRSRGVVTGGRRRDRVLSQTRQGASLVFVALVSVWR